MNKEVFYSVIMSVYNDQDNIEASIKSILSQSFNNFEFIIIDDGSTDDSLNIIKSYVKVDNRIKFYSNVINLGLTKSLNHAIEKSKGVWLVRQDSDDISLPNRLKDAYEAINCNHFDFYSTPAILFGKNKMTKIVPNKLTRSFFDVGFLKFKNCLVHGTLIIKKSVLKKVFYNENFIYSQDFKLYHDLINKGFILFYNKSSISYKLRVHEKSLTQINRLEQLNYFNKVLIENNLPIFKNSLKGRLMNKILEIKLILKKLF